MALPSPNLDDRSFEQLLDDAKSLVARSDSGWTDLGPGDPGEVLLEAFAYLTSLMLYRVNRLPEKVHVELLRLIGVKQAPPAAARALLSFSLARPSDQPTEIPAGTRVTVSRRGAGEPPVFATVAAAVIPAGEVAVHGLLALHCTTVEGELAGAGSGLPGQWVQAAQAPLIAASGDDLDLRVGVEATADELTERVHAVPFEGKVYRIWQAVEHFAASGPQDCHYLVDRASGRVHFAQALRVLDDEGRLEAGCATLAQVPAPGRSIRLWYRRGGGEAGNLPAHALTVLRDARPGLLVTNPEPATGGAAAETVDNAMRRGPEAMHSLRRAVTARDFEALALRSSAAVVRAKAVTQAELWRHALPGTVEVLLVPSLGSFEQRGGGRVTREALQAQETDAARQAILAALDYRRPLGTTCVVNWVRCKPVTVKVDLVVHRGEDAAAVRTRALDRLHQVINPLPTPLQRGGWPFGQALRASHVYDIVLAEPGVAYVDHVSFVVDEVPAQDVRALACDPVQPATWYAASGETLYRSLNDGDGWEAAGRFAGELVDSVATQPARAGLLGVATRLADASARVQVSWDCGETWRQVGDFAFPVNDLAWIERNGVQVLLLATDKGLYELAMQADAAPVQLTVDAANPTGGFYAVAAFADGRGGSNVAVAARQHGGVFLSRQGGRTESFERIHPGEEDIRVLAVQRLGSSVYLWAGLTSPGNEAGRGCLRWELPSSPGSTESPDGWRPLAQGWEGGSCRTLAFEGEKVYAGTHSAGVAVLDGPAWKPSSIQCRLPMRGTDKLFAPVEALAVARGSGVLMAGGPMGVSRSRDGAAFFEDSSRQEFAERVALPATWLFCSGPHQVHATEAGHESR
jgi:hypothetical protein